MKLLNAQVTFNDTTFAPDLILTLSIPIETMHDLSLIKGEFQKDLCQIYGERLLDILQNEVKDKLPKTRDPV